jgi:hypothetical protein
MRRVLAFTCGVLLLALGVEIHAIRVRVASEQTSGPVSATERRVGRAYGSLPLSFEANRGQTDRRVKFLARGAGYSLFLTATQAVVELGTPSVPAGRSRLEGKAAQVSVLRMGLVGANTHPRVLGRDRLPGRANYLLGHDLARWQAGVPTYERILYPDVYHGVDLLYYGTQGQLEFDFDLAPGADPRSIGFRFRGADGLRLDAGGDLLVKLAGGELRLGSPHIYQDLDGIRREVPGGYSLTSRGEIGFHVAEYDASEPLVIDPVLLYATYLGGMGIDGGNGIAVDGSGAAYVVGATNSTNFPTTTGQLHIKGSFDAFVTKLNSTGSGLLYSTYLGGSGSDFGLGVDVDAAGNTYVTGFTESTNFPTKTPFQGSSGGGFEDAFVTKLNSTGSGLLYSTYLGGADLDTGAGIAVDSAGSAYVTGTTASTNFPTTMGAFQGAFGGGDVDGFVAKFNPTGSSVAYSTYLGGAGAENSDGIAVDGLGNAYVTGATESADFPTTAGAFQPALAPGRFGDAFVTKLNPTGRSLVYSTFLGGSSGDSAYAIAVDSATSAYVAGQTDSTNFPTASPFQPASAGVAEAFVTKLNPSGGGLVYSTYLGGSSEDGARGIAVDALSSAYVTGFTESFDFHTASPFQPAFGGGEADAFVTKLNPSGGGLVYSTYLGGGGTGSIGDSANGIAVDHMANPNAYVTGATDARDFPVTMGAFQASFGGGQGDGFVAKIANPSMPPPTSVRAVTGGGSVSVSGLTGTFGFVVQQRASGEIEGMLQYVNHSTGAIVRSVRFTYFAVSGNTATFRGTCTLNGTPCTFMVSVTDKDQSGGNDTFTITYPPTASIEGGTLLGGNIQIHNG